ncbi:hypothetical protein SKAU_G00363480 [Synaphobranchus kaupii]|uniref:Uncharacterized protein n=1 Tax=Synaphobranchus kaupii TaxID=118154 RepID=A0A9Q1EIT7_SYNKA|nr:hypothetical protein SKAU_G00363480 [Synaphobranchus kaupii]
MGRPDRLLPCPSHAFYPLIPPPPLLISTSPAPRMRVFCYPKRRWTSLLSGKLPVALCQPCPAPSFYPLKQWAPFLVHRNEDAAAINGLCFDGGGRADARREDGRGGSPTSSLPSLPVPSLSAYRPAESGFCQSLLTIRRRSVRVKPDGLSARRASSGPRPPQPTAPKNRPSSSADYRLILLFRSFPQTNENLFTGLTNQGYCWGLSLTVNPADGRGSLLSTEELLQELADLGNPLTVRPPAGRLVPPRPVLRRSQRT